MGGERNVKTWDVPATSHRNIVIAPSGRIETPRRRPLKNLSRPDEDDEKARGGEKLRRRGMFVGESTGAETLGTWCTPHTAIGRVRSTLPVMSHHCCRAGSGKQRMHVMKLQEGRERERARERERRSEFMCV